MKILLLHFHLEKIIYQKVVIFIIPEVESSKIIPP